MYSTQTQETLPGEHSVRLSGSVSGEVIDEHSNISSGAVQGEVTPPTHATQGSIDARYQTL